MTQLISDLPTAGQLATHTAVRRPQTDKVAVDDAEFGRRCESNTDALADDNSLSVVRINATLHKHQLAKRPTTINSLLAQHVACLCVVSPTAVLLGMPPSIVVSYASGVVGTTAWLLIYAGTTRDFRVAHSQKQSSNNVLGRHAANSFDHVEWILELAVLIITIATVVAVFGVVVAVMICT